MSQIYLYDPITNIKTPITYERLSGITGKPIISLMSLKSKRLKISSINCYIVDDNVSKKELYELMCRQKIKDEIWKDIKGSNGYQISSYGRVRKLLKSGKERLLCPYIWQNKRICIKIKHGDKFKHTAIHKLVAEHFLENENGYTVVYHKNGNKYDNYAGNLAWTDSKSLGKRTGHKANSIAVFKLDPCTGEVLDEYESMAEAGRQNYLHKESIRQCVRGMSKASGGFKWVIDTEFYQEENIAN